MTDEINEPATQSERHLIPATLAFGALAVVAAAVVAALGWILYSSHTSYGIGLDLVREAATTKGYDPTSAARRIFFLSSGQQVTAFKVAAFGISALLALVGGVFILNGAEASYRLGLSHGGIRSALETTSPGLVIITLSMALAAFTLGNKSQVRDQEDFDVARWISSSLKDSPVVNDERLTQKWRVDLPDLEKDTAVLLGESPQTTSQQEEEGKRDEATSTGGRER